MDTDTVAESHTWGDKTTLKRTDPYAGAQTPAKDDTHRSWQAKCALDNTATIRIKRTLYRKGLPQTASRTFSNVSCNGWWVRGFVGGASRHGHHTCRLDFSTHPRLGSRCSWIVPAWRLWRRSASRATVAGTRALFDFRPHHDA